MDPLETRQLRYFAAVAEELHFGRAARRLSLAQPALSRAIQQLERRLGLALLERTTRSVRLTPAGAVLAEEARRALDAVTAAEQRTRRAAEPSPRLLVATKAESDGGLLPAILRVYAEEQPGVEAQVLLGGWGEQARMLRDGRADVALLHAPFDARGIDFEPLLSEPRVVALASSHPLAPRRRLTLAELAGEPLPRWEGDGGEEIAPLWCGREPEAGRGPRPGLPQPARAEQPPVADVSQLLRLVELGQVVAFVPASVARRYPRPEIAYRAVRDLTPLRLVVAWPGKSSSLGAAAFVRAATSVAAQHATATPDLALALPG